MSNNESNARQTAAAATQDDDEPDEWLVLQVEVVHDDAARGEHQLLAITRCGHVV